MLIVATAVIMQLGACFAHDEEGVEGSLRMFGVAVAQWGEQKP